MVTSEGKDEAVLPSQLTEWSMPIFLEPLVLGTQYDDDSGRNPASPTEHSSYPTSPS